MNVPLNPLEFRLRAVSYYGDKVGIVDGNKRFTYAEYNTRVNRFANALANLGIGKTDVISFIIYNSHQLLEAYFAVPQIEAILNPINIRLSQSEIEYVLNHAETRVLCFHKDFLPLVTAMRGALPEINHYIIIEADIVPQWAYGYEELLCNASPEHLQML